MLKNYPYNISDNYEDLYNYLMYFDTFFIIALSKQTDIYFKMFKMRKCSSSDIYIADDMYYRNRIKSKKDFINICKELQIYWIVPNK